MSANAIVPSANVNCAPFSFFKGVSSFSPVPWKSSVPSDQVASFNQRVAAIVDRYADAGYRITWVAGMTDAIDGGVENLPDGIHPSQPAYGRMAAQWFQALESVSGE